MSQSTLRTIKCKLGVHSWDEWDMVRRGTLVNDEERCVGYFVIQERMCACCGKVELNTQRTYI